MFAMFTIFTNFKQDPSLEDCRLACTDENKGLPPPVFATTD